MNDAYYYNKIGNDLLSKKSYDEALLMYLKAISINSKEPMFYHNAGVCLMLKGESERAISLFEHAIKIGINLDETKYYLIKILFELERYEKVVNSSLPEKNFKIDAMILKAKAALRINKNEDVKKILNELEILGYTSQETELIQKMI
ncbi:hypothetical protein OSSY52_06010 [Tepiditoga spiralis]|uniref:Uncharacterized protein n=1 Tax=Tepiditoga spiralis TaxID=2108365 RepID=A0A7G1G288_9BACT|nr:hypothetical protein [Tepiditoga spiralis]BBE30460.1 hypothetical protein OSSY52_06010 [Tepiditoga spiralis]